MTEYLNKKELLEDFNKRLSKAVGDKTVSLDAIKTYLENRPVAEAVSLEVYKQVRWERDVAISQLEAIGKSFGEKMDDVAPIKHAKWVYQYWFICSNCGNLSTRGKKKYCSNCGARMDGR